MLGNIVCGRRSRAGTATATPRRWPVEGHIEFGFAGAVVFCLVLGLLFGLVDRFGAAATDGREASTGPVDPAGSEGHARMVAGGR